MSNHNGPLPAEMRTIALDRALQYHRDSAGTEFDVEHLLASAADFFDFLSGKGVYATAVGTGSA